MLWLLNIAAVRLCVGASWREGTLALRNQAPGVDAIADMVHGRRGARGLLYMDFGRRHEFTAQGWRHRNRRNAWMLGALAAMLTAWVTAG